jgi:hypothetical protein
MDEEAATWRRRGRRRKRGRRMRMKEAGEGGG